MRPLALIAVAFAVLSCTPAQARAPDPPGRDLPNLTFAVAAGDTAKGSFTYTAGARSSGALATVRATSYPTSTWVGLPTNVARPAAGTVAFVATNTTADSADMVPCVTWTNGSGQSAELCGPSRRWRRPPGTGTIGWDSLGVAVRPDTATILLGSARPLCGFKTFYPSGHVAVRSADRAACDSIAVRFFTAAQRAVTPAEQAHEDAACYAWSSALPLKVPVTPAASCSAAARIDGLQLTWAPDALRDLRPRYAAASRLELPVATVSATGLLTCLRPGVAHVPATSEGVTGSLEYRCPAVPIPVQIATR